VLRGRREHRFQSIHHVSVQRTGGASGLGVTYGIFVCATAFSRTVMLSSSGDNSMAKMLALELWKCYFAAISSHSWVEGRIPASLATRWALVLRRLSLRGLHVLLIQKPSMQVQVMIWDDHQGRCIGELTFRNQVWLQLSIPWSTTMRNWVHNEFTG
jgi:hypothetical protein